MRTIFTIATVLLPTIGIADDHSLKFSMRANVLICDTLDQLVETIESKAPVKGCGFTRRVYNVEMFPEVPYVAHDLTFELVRFEFPFMGVEGGNTVVVQYGLMGQPEPTFSLTLPALSV